MGHSCRRLEPSGSAGSRHRGARSEPDVLSCSPLCYAQALQQEMEKSFLGAQSSLEKKKNLKALMLGFVQAWHTVEWNPVLKPTCCVCRPGTQGLSSPFLRRTDGEGAPDIWGRFLTGKTKQKLSKQEKKIVWKKQIREKKMHRTEKSAV